MSPKPQHQYINAMTEGPVGRKLVDLTIPMALGLVALMLFNAIDTLYVGQLGKHELAAMSFTFPLTFLIISLGIGLGVGTSSAIARAIGRGQHAQVRSLTTHSLLLAAVVTAIASTIGFATVRPVFRAMGAGPTILPLIEDYMTVWYLGCVLFLVPMTGSNAIRGTGDMKTPSLIIAAAGAVNVVLDPFLIFGWGPFPRLGLRGAALATVISWTLSSSLAAWALTRGKDMISFARPRWSEILASWRDILYVGVPAAATNMLVPLATAALTRIISVHGPEAIAAFGVGSRLESLALIGCFSMSGALTPFVGQNLGTANWGRIREALAFSIRFSFAWGAAAWLVLAVLAYPLAAVFNRDPDVIHIACRFLWIVPCGFGGYGATMQIISVFNAIKRPSQAVIVIALRLFALVIPCAWIGSRTGGPVGIFVGVTVGNLVSGLLGYWFINRHLRQSTAS